MITQDLILQNWLNQENIFNNNLEICRKKHSKKAVHDIRVSIKKLRSYIRLCNTITGKDFKPAFQPVVQLFRSFGKLRDNEIALDILKGLNTRHNISSKKFEKYLKVNRSLCSRWAQEDAKLFNDDILPSISESLGTNCIYISSPEMEEKIRMAIDQNMQRTRTFADEFTKQVHKIRKLLKDVYYWSLLHEDLSEASGFTKKELDKILDLLGTWQDYFIFENKLKIFRKSYLQKGDTEFEKIKILAEISKVESDQFLQNAIELWLSHNKKSD